MNRANSRSASQLALQKQLIELIERLDPELGERVGELLENRLEGGRARRILVVDDSRACRMLATHILGAAGYEVRSAGDGAQAWSLLQESSFDLVVSDLEMPEMGGIDLLQKVRSSGALSDLPVILNSCVSDPSFRDEALAAGANDFIMKSGASMKSQLLHSVARWSGGND